MGIGISSFTEIVGAGPSRTFDILGLQMFDSCEIRVHPTGKAMDDCGNIINPMIVDGQIHGGLTMGMAPVLLE